MESIIISAKRFPVIIFWAFSDQLEVKGNRVESAVHSDYFMWRLVDGHGNSLSPYHEIPRDPGSARFKDDDAYLLKSMNADLITGFFRREFLRFKESL